MQEYKSLVNLKTVKNNNYNLNNNVNEQLYTKSLQQSLISTALATPNNFSTKHSKSNSIQIETL